MPALHQRHRQPIAALWYSSIGAIAIALLALVIGSALATSQIVAGASGTNEGGLLMLIVLLLAFIAIAHPVLYYFLFSYELSEQAITVNSGILFRQYESINYDRVQVIDNERGPLLMLFGLTEMRIWTASPDQFDQEHAGHLHPRPDAAIILTKDGAEAVKQFMTHAHSSSGGGL